MKALRILWQVVDIAMAALMLSMILLVFTNVVLRYGFASGMRPAIELSRLAFVWLVMLGAAVVLRRNDHLAVTDFVAHFLPRLVPVLRRLAYGVVTFSMLMLLWGAFRQMNANWHNISQLTGLPSALFYLSGVISGGLMVLIGVVRMIEPDALCLPGDIQTEEVGK